MTGLFAAGILIFSLQLEEKVDAPLMQTLYTDVFMPIQHYQINVVEVH